MENMTHKPMPLALSQHFGKTLKSRQNRSPVNKVMPFLYLDRMAHKRGAAGYPVINSLNELEWQEPRPTGFNKNIHQHNNIYQNSVHHEGPRHIDIRNTVEKQETSLISGALSFHPLLIEANKQTASAPGRINIDNRQRTTLQLSGMFSSHRPRRQAHARMNPSKPLKLTDPAYHGLSWSLPASQALGATQTTGQQPLAGMSVTDRAVAAQPFVASLEKGSENKPSSAPTMPDKLIERRLITAQSLQPRPGGNDYPSPSPLAERLVYANGMIVAAEELREKSQSSGNAQFLVPAALPNRKLQFPITLEQSETSSTFSATFIKKIERLISEKLEQQAPVRNSDKAIIDEVKKELRERLRPESIVNEHMIRVLKAKLQRSWREERFRLGLMS